VNVDTTPSLELSAVIHGVIPNTRVFTSGRRDLSYDDAGGGDPSLRLKSACAQDDAGYSGQNKYGTRAAV